MKFISKLLIDKALVSHFAAKESCAKLVIGLML